jgi:spermidine synthase
MDAFSSDSVPTHLLTKEAMALYLSKLKPDGLLVVHVTNRHLALEGPVAAAMQAAGAQVLVRGYAPPPGTEELTALNSDVMVASRDPATLAALEKTGWSKPATVDERPWSDDYVNLIGALIAGTRR